MAIETPTWIYKSKGDKQTASEMNQLAQSVIMNATELSNIKDDFAELGNKTYRPEIYSGMGRVILRKNMVNGVNVLTQEMINQSNTIYEIRYDFDLNGAEITIPDNCVLMFKGGALKNGTLNGNNTILNIKEKTLYNIVFNGNFIADKNIIDTNIFITWTPKDLNNICNIITNGGTINCSSDITSGVHIRLNKSITLEGNGHTLKTINTSNNRTIGIFDIRDTDNFSLKNLTIDGGINVTYDSNGDPKVENQGAYENTYVLFFNNVKTVEFYNCKFKNIYAHSLDNYLNPKYYGTGFIVSLDYTSFIFRNCEFRRSDNVFTGGEGIKLLPKTPYSEINTNEDYDEHNIICAWAFAKGGHVNLAEYNIVVDDNAIIESLNNTEKYPNIAIIENCYIDYTLTSSAIEIDFGTCSIKNNYFGITTGSTLNAFVKDSTIENNKFEGVHRSCVIDLVEDGVFGFKPKNVIIKNNISNFAGESFCTFGDAENIYFIGNIVDWDKINTGIFDFYDRKYGVKKRLCRSPFIIFSGGKNIVIEDNKLLNYCESAIFWHYTTADYTSSAIVRNNYFKAKGVKIDENGTDPKPQIFIRRSGSYIFDNNVFENALPIYFNFVNRQVPAFICTQGIPYKGDVNLKITNNKFTSSYDRGVGLAIVPEQITDNWANISKLEYCGNTFNFIADNIIFPKNSDLTPSLDTNKDIIIKNNKFNNGNLYCLTKCDTDEKSLFNQDKNNSVIKNLSIKDNYNNGYIAIKGDILETTFNYLRNNNLFRALYNGFIGVKSLIIGRNKSINYLIPYINSGYIYVPLNGGTTNNANVEYDTNIGSLTEDGNVKFINIGKIEIEPTDGFLPCVSDYYEDSNIVVFPKDITVNENDFNRSNVMFIINSNINLNGQTLNIGENSSIIVYGRIQNGTLNGNNSKFISLNARNRNTVSFIGSWTSFTDNLPTYKIPGEQIFLPERNKPVYWNNEKWVDSDGEDFIIKRSGNTSERPIPTNIGFIYYDTTLNKPIWWTGSTWVDATGATV